jgi:hypothetical protein
LAWTNASIDPLVNDSFQLIWQLADASLPADTVSIAVADDRYTITGLLPDRAYTLRACAECTAGQPVCIELAPIGGCPARYAPLLADLSGPNALLGWLGDSLGLAVELYWKPAVSPSWSAAPIGQLSFFNPADFGLALARSSELRGLQPGLNYVARLRNLCRDSLWSDWSPPVHFNTDCAAVDSLFLPLLADTAAVVAGFAVANAEQYVFEYRRLGSSTWIRREAGLIPSLLLTGLLPDTEYEVRLQYACSLGPWSDYSAVLVFRTQVTCRPPSAYRAAPTYYEAADLSWTPHPNAQATELRYRNKIAGYYGFLSGAWEVASGLVDSMLQLVGLWGSAQRLVRDGTIQYPVWAAPGATGRFATLRLRRSATDTTRARYPVICFRLPGAGRYGLDDGKQLLRLCLPHGTGRPDDLRSAGPQPVQYR